MVTPFQLQSYTTAASQGWLAAMWIAAVIMAPAGEEVIFRGFLFRGWARSDRSTWPAIVVISLLWAALHVQYDWAGIAQIFVVGLYLGDPCDGHPPCFLTANPVFGFWGISLTMLWQKAHFGSAFIAQKFRARRT